MALLVHLPRESVWRAAATDGAFRPPSLAEEGFIHLCRPQEAVMVANLLFRDIDDLLAVAIDSRRLDAPVRLDQARPGAWAWPHLHGPLNLAAVMRVRPYSRRPDGRYPRLPHDLRRLDCGTPLRFHDLMTAAEVVAVLDLLAAVEPVVDGGWAVDAVLGRQRREHGDLDLCIAGEHIAHAVALLEQRGYDVTEDGRPARVELRTHNWPLTMCGSRVTLRVTLDPRNVTLSTRATRPPPGRPRQARPAGGATAADPAPTS